MYRDYLVLKVVRMYSVVLDSNAREANSFLSSLAFNQNIGCNLLTHTHVRVTHTLRLARHRKKSETNDNAMVGEREGRSRKKTRKKCA